MSAKKTPAKKTSSPPAPAAAPELSLVERVAQANLANIMRKVKAGSSLTAAETRTLADARRADEARATEMLRRGMAALAQIRDIIEESALPRTLKQRIYDKIAIINV